MVWVAEGLHAVALGVHEVVGRHRYPSEVFHRWTALGGEQFTVLHPCDALHALEVGIVPASGLQGVAQLEEGLFSFADHHEVDVRAQLHGLQRHGRVVNPTRDHRGLRACFLHQVGRHHAVVCMGGQPRDADHIGLPVPGERGQDLGSVALESVDQTNIVVAPCAECRRNGHETDKGPFAAGTASRGPAGEVDTG